MTSHNPASSQKLMQYFMLFVSILLLLLFVDSFNKGYDLIYFYLAFILIYVLFLLNKEHSLTRAALKEKKKLHDLVDAFTVGVAVLNPSMKVLFCNKRLEKLLSRKKIDLINENICEIIKEQLNAQNTIDESRLMSGGCAVTTKTGLQLYLETSDFDGNRLMIIKDITQTAKATHKNRQIKDTTETFISLLEKGGKDDIPTVISGLKKLQLHLKFETGEAAVLHEEELSCKSICAETESMLLRYTKDAKESFQIVTKFADDARLHGDKTLILTAIEYLIENACAYTQPKDRKIKVTLEDNIDSFKFVIVDNGSGLEYSEDRSKIFDQFYRAKNATDKNLPGFGLGLYLVQSIIRLHDGNIWTETSNNAFKISFTLPRKI